MTDITNDWIKVGLSTCGIAAGAQVVYDVLKEESQKRNIAIDIKQCGCSGNCAVEPVIQVRVEGLPIVTYGRVDSATAIKILEKHVCGKRLVNDHIYGITVTNDGV
jgi:NADP-reducing hydrogenase subunit HndB